MRIGMGGRVKRAHMTWDGVEAAVRTRQRFGSTGRHWLVFARGHVVGAIEMAPHGRSRPLYGVISIGVPTSTSDQISSISVLVTATQPSVQSWARWEAPSQP
jgi:hypothetical protein